MSEKKLKIKKKIKYIEIKLKQTNLLKNIEKKKFFQKKKNLKNNS